jgi:hypothetical protein
MFKSRRDVDVNEHERLSNITLRHKLDLEEDVIVKTVKTNILLKEAILVLVS